MKKHISILVIIVYLLNVFNIINLNIINNTKAYFEPSSWFLIKNEQTWPYFFNPWDSFSMDFKSNNNSWEDIKEVYFKANFWNNSGFWYTWTDQKMTINWVNITSPVPISAYENTNWFSYEITDSSNLQILNNVSFNFSRSSNKHTWFYIKSSINSYQNDLKVWIEWKRVSDNSIINWSENNKIIYVNVKPHIIDYYFSKSSIIWDWIDSTDLILKVKDYNWCWNISWWLVTANLSKIWLSWSEALNYISCESDWKTAIFKKSWITNLSSPWDQIFTYSDFSAKDVDNNYNSPNDSNTIFSNEDKKSNITLSIITVDSPIVTISSINPNLVSNQSSTITFSSTQTWSFKIVANWDWYCSSWDILIDWTDYNNIWESINFNVLSNLLKEWDNILYTCVKNDDSHIWTSNIKITKDTIIPEIKNKQVVTANINDSNSYVSFECNETWFYRVIMNWFDTWYISTVSNEKEYVLLHFDYMTNIENTINIYCKDLAWNEWMTTEKVIKVDPTPDMWAITNFIDDDIDNAWLNWKDISISWDNSNIIWATNFESYRIYLLPENIDFDILSNQKYIKLITDINQNTWSWTTDITKDSLEQDLISWNSYKICMIIMWKNWILWLESCSLPTVLTWDIIQNAKILSARFTKNDNLEVTTDTILDTNLNSHYSNLASYMYLGNIFNPFGVSSIDWMKINFLIPELNNLSATWSSLIFLTWSLRSAWWGYNNYFESLDLIITDWQAPLITLFWTWTESIYNNYYSWSLLLNYTLEEEMKGNWFTKIIFTRNWWNHSEDKTYNIIYNSNLTPWEKNLSLDLNEIWLVSWTNYEVKIIWEDISWNKSFSSPINIKFDNKWPYAPILVNLPWWSSIQTPTLFWNNSIDDDWNWSWVKDYKLNIYSWSDCSWIIVQSFTWITTTSQTTSILSNGNYSWNVFARDNLLNIWNTSICDNFFIDTTIPWISNQKITNTSYNNSTSYTKNWDTVEITANLTNTNISNIKANLSAITWNPYNNEVSCNSPSSWITCTFDWNNLKYILNVWVNWNTWTLVKQAKLIISNASWLNTIEKLLSINVDNVSPTIWNITSPIWIIWWNSNNITWSWISDENLENIKIEYSWNWWLNYSQLYFWNNNWNYIWDTSSLSASLNYKIKITATDKAWNTSITESWIFIFDDDDPIIQDWTITYPISNQYIKWNSIENITWNNLNITDIWWLDINPISLYYSSDDWNTYNLIASSLPNNWIYIWNTPNINSTNIKLKIVAKDKVWHTSEYVTNYNFKIDSILPVLNLDIGTPTNNSYINESWFDLIWSTSDSNLDKIEYTFKRLSDNKYWDWSNYVWLVTWNNIENNITTTDYNFNLTLLPNISNWENYELIVKSSDKAWNENILSARNYTADTINPTLNVLNWNLWYFSWNINIIWTSNDNLAWVSSVKISIKKWDSYWNWNSWTLSETILAVNSVDNYNNWNYDFSNSLIDEDWQKYDFKVFAYDKTYKVNNSSNYSFSLILDKTPPTIDSNIFTFNTLNKYHWWNVLNITWDTSWFYDELSWLAENPIILEFFDWNSWSEIADNLVNNWSYDYILPLVDTSIWKIRIKVIDKLWNSSNYVLSNSFFIDSTDPTIILVETKWDTLWWINWFIVEFSEEILNAWNLNINSIFSVSDWIILNSSYLNTIVNNKTIIELQFTSSIDWTSFTPTLNYNWNIISDLAWRKLASGSIISIDKAEPRIINSEIFDTNWNGKFDKIEVTFSENLSLTNDDSVFSLNNTLVWMNISSVSIVDNKANIIISESIDYNTDSSWITLNFNSNWNWKDLLNNQAWSIWIPNLLIDKAKPVLISANLNDNNQDYIWDNIELSFSEKIFWDISWISISSWAINTYQLTWNILNLSISWINWTDPNIFLDYINWNIEDINWNTLSLINNKSIFEKISPKILLKETIDSNNNWKIDNIRIIFSENLNWNLSDLNIDVNWYTVNNFIMDWDNSILINLNEKLLADTNSTPIVKILSNNLLGDINNNPLIADINWSLAVDKVWPIITLARFDELNNELNLTFSEEVGGSLNNSSFILSWSNSNITNVEFINWSKTAILTLDWNWIIYWISKISFLENTVWDLLWNKQSSTYFNNILGSILINEIMFSWDLQYIELKNISSTSIDISNWIIENALWNWNNYIIPSNQEIEAWWYYLISTNDNYFSWINSNQIVDLNISNNLILKNENNIIIDKWLYQTSEYNTSIERLENCFDNLDSSCWYKAIVNNWFNSSNYFWTPKSLNIYDNINPILSTNIIDNLLLPTWYYSINYMYSDNIEINTWSIDFSLEKWNWLNWVSSTWYNIWNISLSWFELDINWLEYWKYKATFSIWDTSNNISIISNIFYVDNFSISIDNNNINLWILSPLKLKMSEDYVNVEIKTIWAWFNLLHSYENSDILDWEGDIWYWACEWEFCSNLENYKSKNIVNQSWEIQTTWNLKTYNYKIKYWALIDSIQKAWIYNIINKYEISLNY